MNTCTNKQIIELANEILKTELMRQKEAHDSLVSLLNHRINSLEREIDEKNDVRFIHYLFLSKKHEELIEEFVEFAYREIPDTAKIAVQAFHDGILDLSTIPCTGNDFKPW